MHDEQLTDLERLTLSRRSFIGAGALTGAALFLRALRAPVCQRSRARPRRRA